VTPVLALIYTISSKKEDYIAGEIIPLIMICLYVLQFHLTQRDGTNFKKCCHGPDDSYHMEALWITEPIPGGWGHIRLPAELGTDITQNDLIIFNLRLFLIKRIRIISC
jgi:hypothetical protein